MPGWWTTCCRKGVTRPGTRKFCPAHPGFSALYWPSLRPFDGARDLLAQCCEGGLAVALASSSRKDQDLKALRSSLAADAFIHAATSSNDAEESKPEPDILVAALSAVGWRRPTPSTWGRGLGRLCGGQAGHAHHRPHLRRHQ